MLVFTSYYNMAIELQNDSSVIWIPCSNTIPFYFNRLNMVLPPYENRLAPPWSIINPYKEGKISYDVFKQEYIKYLDSKFDKEEVLSWVKSIQDKYTDRILVFLCYEEDTNTCHRSILCNWLGVNVRELSDV